jgi:hypothetical protein
MCELQFYEKKNSYCVIIKCMLAVIAGEVHSIFWSGLGTVRFVINIHRKSWLLVPRRPNMRQINRYRQNHKYKHSNLTFRVFFTIVFCVNSQHMVNY